MIFEFKKLMGGLQGNLPLGASSEAHFVARNEKQKS